MANSGDVNSIESSSSVGMDGGEAVMFGSGFMVSTVIVKGIWVLDKPKISKSVRTFGFGDGSLHDWKDGYCFEFKPTFFCFLS